MDLIVLQTNASVTFQVDHWYIGHVYLITVHGYPIFERLERNQYLLGYRNPVRTQISPRIYFR
jgi:hypothetical protein